MEKRAIIAALLMAGLLIAYQTFFMQAPEVPVPPKAEAPGPKPVTSPAPAPASSPAAAAVPSPVPVAAVPARTARVEAPLYKAHVSSHGGDLSAWELNYRGLKPMIVPGQMGPRGITIERAGQPPLVVDFSLSPESLDLGKAAARGEITLVGDDGFGLRITETLRFRADGYDVERVLRVENRGRAAQTAGIVIGWSAPITWPKDVPEKFQGQHPTRVVRVMSDKPYDGVWALSCHKAPTGDNFKDKYGWEIAAMALPQAWALVPPPGGRKYGEGICVGHPDTGYSDHQALESARLLKNEGDDCVDDDVDARDILDANLVDSEPGHGTAFQIYFPQTDAALTETVDEADTEADLELDEDFLRRIREV
jgi:hypothetical protein